MPRGKELAAGAAFVAVVGLVACRIWLRLDDPSAPVSRYDALVDFRDAVYYPAVAFLNGENPYDRARFVAHYPVYGSIGLYSPLALALHAPFGLLPYRTAQAAWVAITVALTVLMAAVALRSAGRPATPAAVLVLATVLVLSRPGHWNLYLGQVAAVTALLTWATVWLAPRHPVFAGVALALASFKPTYGGPLLLLALLSGRWRVAAVGVATAMLATAAPLARIVAPIGLNAFLGTLVVSLHDRFDRPELSASRSFFRVDVVALCGRILGEAPSPTAMAALAALVLGVAAMGLRPLTPRTDGEARLLALTITALAVVLCAYHLQYDLVVLVPALFVGASLQAPRRARLLSALVAVPFVNYLASGSASRGLDMPPAALLGISSVNTVALLGAFGLAIILAYRPDGVRVNR